LARLRTQEESFDALRCDVSAHCELGTGVVEVGADQDADLLIQRRTHFPGGATLRRRLAKNG
jgi:hypothetical protein